MLLAACGGSGSPTAPEMPTAGTSVTVTVFYDENGNGMLDAGELGRLPGASVEVAGHSARTEPGTGRATVSGVPDGAQTAAVSQASLPPFYRAGAPVALSVPQDHEVALPVTLPIGGNRPNVYLAFGDSITDGDGSSDDQGYRSKLEALLHDGFGTGTIIADGIGGTTSVMGQRRIKTSLAQYQPAYTLILYGTNDWNSDECNSTIDTCYTASALTAIVEHVKTYESLPVIATIPPANTGYDERAPADRNIRVQQQNQQIVALAQAEGALLVDIYTAFMSTPDFHALFSDHVHPNDAGYELMARTFYNALSQPAAGGAARAAPTLGVPPLLFERPRQQQQQRAVRGREAGVLRREP
jgi:acyl-CoA thioesterase I